MCVFRSGVYRALVHFTVVELPSTLQQASSRSVDPSQDIRTDKSQITMKVTIHNPVASVILECRPSSFVAALKRVYIGMLACSTFTPHLTCVPTAHNASRLCHLNHVLLLQAAKALPARLNLFNSASVARRCVVTQLLRRVRQRHVAVSTGLASVPVTRLHVSLPDRPLLPYSSCSWTI